MKQLARLLLSAAGLLGLAGGGNVAASPEALPPSLLEIPVPRMDGTEAPLSEYAGRVLLIVNVASKCGSTPQYAGLQTLHARYAERGLSILAFPANDFANQEPGSNEEIREFCALNYGVEFPLFAKISVKGKDMHPLYRYLCSQESNPGFGGDISWNFNKFLVDREGRVIARFGTRVQPLSDEIVAAVEAALVERP